MRPTQAQGRAIQTTERNLILRAGAGTGKTLVLVEHFLFLLKQRLATPTEVAAITYTEKAANELKVRLRQGALQRERSAATVEERRYWRRCRLDVERACIGTFHAFCARLLRERALRAGLDPNFAVLEEAAALILRRRAVQETLPGWVEQQGETALAELLGAFEFRRLEDLLTIMLQRPEVCESAALRFGEQDPEEMRRWWEDRRQRIQKQILQALVNDPRWQACLQELSQYQAADPDDKAEQNRKRILALAPGVLTAEDPGATLLRLREACNRRVGSGKNWSEDDLHRVKELFRILRDEVLKEQQDALSSVQPTGLEERAALGLRALGRLYLALRDRYRRLKDEEGALDFDDLLLRARDLLRDDRLVRSYYQRHLRYLLVDEFQDNAQLEREILFFLAEGGARAAKWDQVELVPGKLFIVGDDKQSIYRFRGADVTVFNDTAHRLASPHRDDTLQESFRSTPALIEFLNALFSSVMGEAERAELFQSRHLPLVAHRGPVPGARGVGGEPAVEVLAVPVEGGETLHQAREREARALAARLGQLTDNVPVVVDDETGDLRPARLSEVAVLLRALSEVELYERALREAGLPYYLIGGTEYYQRAEVRAVVSALRAALSPADETALAGWLRSPMCGLSDEALWLLAREDGLRRGLERAVELLSEHPEAPRALRAREVLVGLRSEVGRLSVSEVLEHLFSRTGYLATVQASFAGRQQRANLEQLLELARGLEGSGRVSLREFVQLMEELAVRGPREEPAATIEEAGEAIRLMTIHQAKGLEFPIVCVADLGRGQGGRRRPLLIHGELGFAAKLKTWGEDGDENGSAGESLPWRLLRWQEGVETEAESERLLYVAATRARDYLVLSGPWYEPSDRRVARGWMGWVRAGLPEDVPLPEPGEEATVPFHGVNVRLRQGVRTDEAGAALRRRSAQGWEKLTKELPTLAADRKRVQALRDQLAPLSVAPGSRESVPASALADFARCPYYFYLKDVVGMPEAVLQGQGDAPRGGPLLGQVVHEVLKEFPARSDQELLHRVGEVCQQMAGGSAPNDLRKQATALVGRWLAGPLAAEVRGARRWRTELPFACRVGEQLVEGRIDLLWEGSDGRLCLLDYKTDRVDEQGAHRHGEYLSRQVTVYWLAVTRLLGRRPGRAGLYFLSPNVEVPLPGPLVEDEVEDQLGNLLKQMDAGPYPRRRGEGCPCGYASVCQ